MWLELQLRRYVKFQWILCGDMVKLETKTNKVKLDHRQSGLIVKSLQPMSILHRKILL